MPHRFVVQYRYVVSAMLLITSCAAPPSRHAQHEGLPDRALTPGDVMDVTAAEICAPGYTKTIRNVPSALKRQVYAAYHEEPQTGVCCEIDHLIPLELGGSNATRNLWPQRYDRQWNAHDKDRLEGRLHRLVCSGKLDLKSAQSAIATDWITAYREYVGGLPTTWGATEHEP
jgi:hypothetical protein